MGNRSIYAVGNDGPPTKMRKTERSHEENQERAYVAASRRADRSIEARVQSARMASEIHKKRTGKGFRISEEIVLKEEMYEEEEEFFPRSHRLLGPHMQTASPEMNLRMEAYLTNRMAMSAMVAGNNDSWRQNDIHTQFAQCFPNANRQAEQLNRRMSQQMMPSPMPCGQSSSENSPVSTTFSHSDRGQSFSSVAPGSVTDAMSPSDSNPKTPASDAIQPDLPMSESSMDPSPFTAELPAEAKMLMAGGGMGMGDPFSQSLCGQGWANNGSFYNFDDNAQGLKSEGFDADMHNNMFQDGTITPAKLDQQEINWGSFVNEDWDNELQQ